MVALLYFSPSGRVSIGRPPRPKRPRDAQRSKVYRWEEVYVRPKGCTAMSRAEVVAWVRRLAWAEAIPEPGCRFSKRSRGSAYFPGRHLIRFSDPYGLKLSTVLHEFAHAVTRKRCGPEVQSHGREFVAIAISLYAKYLDMTERDLRTTAQLAGIKVG
jgi:hypothetical protein